MSTPTDQPRYKLIFTVPNSSLEACKSAIFAKVVALRVCSVHSRSSQMTRAINLGAGCYPGGKYSMVCFETPGTAQFMPNEGAVPNIGKVGELERVEETRVEVLCVGRDVMVGAVDSLKHAHPYEEPAYEVYKMEDI